MRFIADGKRQRRQRLGCLVVVAVGLQLTGCAALHPRADVDFGYSVTSRSGAFTGPLSPPREGALHGPPASAALEPDEHAFRLSNARIDDFVDGYQTRERAFYQRALDRGGRYLGSMTRVLEEESLPPQLAYLPLIESGFRAKAVSPAGAAGPWQFTRATGRRFGLRIDSYVDERRDFMKSTHAAARYLKELYSQFGDWHLSLAAYNCGEGNVARALNRSQTESYWELCERGLLHPETRDFVPRFLAAVRIAQSPEKYGFDSDGENPLHYDLVHIDRSVSLGTVAKLTNSPLSTIADLNPALHRTVTPPKGYTVRVPKGMKEIVEIALARMRHDARELVESRDAIVRTHKLRRGESLGAVAKRYGVQAASLMAANHVRDPRKVRAGRVLRIPVAAATSQSVSADDGPAVARTHKVQRGDTLGKIAARHQIAVASLMKANRIRDPRRVKAGQVLLIPGSGRPSKMLRVASRNRP